MAFAAGAVIRGAVDRLSTTAGGLLIIALTVVGVAQAAAAQDIVRGILDRALSELRDPAIRGPLTADQIAILESVEQQIEAYMADLVLALGLNPIVAGSLWVVAYVLGLAVIVVTIDTFGHERDVITGLETDRLAWKTINLFFGMIVFGILFVIGLILFIIPGLLFALFMVFFPAAIALDGDSFFSAYSKSASVVRSNFLATLALIVVTIVLAVIFGMIGSMLQSALPAAAGPIAAELVSAIVLAFTLALFALAYMTSTRDTESEAVESPEPGVEDEAVAD